MDTIELEPVKTNYSAHPNMADPIQNQTLRECVHRALQNYFVQLEGHPPANIYEMVLAEVEVPLLQVILKYTKSNQSKAAILLGLSRGTLRKKIKQYSIES
ncbi:MAG: DNA-binding transcriptional regulator Fis [Gammaproteobacteria bacterium]|nr:DNA-binding transcriptional regulator Fis [Gammaproteobacteria bacterium]